MKVLIVMMLCLLLSCRDDKPEPVPTKPIVIKPKPPIKKNQLTFAVQYINALKCPDRDVLYVDLFDYTAQEIFDCKQSKKKFGKSIRVLCYFSSQWESWRPDAHITKSFTGKKLDRWRNEKWLRVTPETKQVFIDRIILAKKKNCDGIDVDNLDGFTFSRRKRGFDYSEKEALDFVNFLIRNARKLDLEFSLKNSMALLNSPHGKLDYFKYAMNEECYTWNECDDYDSFEGNLFILRYEDECPAQLYPNGNTLLKNMNLNEWDRPCN